MQSLASQFYAFVVTILMGLIIGVFFDIYRVTKRLVRPGRVLGYLGDVLFWVICTFTVFFMLLVGNWGEIRLYVIIGVLVGTSVYIKFFSGFVVWLLDKIFNIITRIVVFAGKALGITWMIITYPVILVKNIIVIPIGYLGTAWGGTQRFVSRHLRRLVVRPISGRAHLIKNGIRQRWNRVFKK